MAKPVFYLHGFAPDAENTELKRSKTLGSLHLCDEALYNCLESLCFLFLLGLGHEQTDTFA